MKRQRPAAAGIFGDGLELHRHVGRWSGRAHTVITLRPGTRARFSTNRFHDTWRVLSDEQGYVLGRTAGAMLAHADVFGLDDLADIGAVEAYRRMRATGVKGLNLEMLWAMEGAPTYRDRRSVRAERRRELVAELGPKPVPQPITRTTSHRQGSGALSAAAGCKAGRSPRRWKVERSSLSSRKEHSQGFALFP
ncbi:TfoX/Sxy family protein [Nocardia sp. CDC159]|uniref:TfoX/Sxy family protein n=1 Tax=Nocardia pulmonis TaxID=2951408 RepID=A0A9X2EC63_9NOCA|nr:MULTISPECIES: TfoX/Sxy family DNA transformation protein [Nocardia]MCM6776790.1 TfoX/Sxy family protein [Nocardia pulmonis]MCM6789061.1 TfoX/Sxy family protein [Nocardia sp. CDC159]